MATRRKRKVEPLVDDTETQVELPKPAKAQIDDVVKVNLKGQDSVNTQYGTVTPVPIHLFDGVLRAVIPPGALSYIPIQEGMRGKRIRMEATFSFETGIILVTDEVITDGATGRQYILVSNIGIQRIPIKDGFEIGHVVG